MRTSLPTYIHLATSHQDKQVSISRLCSPHFICLSGCTERSTAQTVNWDSIDDPSVPSQGRFIALLEREGQAPHFHILHDSSSFYISPPATGTQLKETIPLPVSISLLGQPRIEAGGILDSPPVMRYDILPPFIPLSPPPTLPTNTLALPEECAEGDTSTMRHSPPTPQVGDLLERPSDLDVAFVSQDKHHSHESTPQLLSPISPKSIPNRISDLPAIREESALLYNRTSSGSGSGYKGQPSGLSQAREPSFDDTEPGQDLSSAISWFPDTIFEEDAEQDMDAGDFDSEMDPEDLACNQHMLISPKSPELPLPTMEDREPQASDPPDPHVSSAPFSNYTYDNPHTFLLDASISTDFLGQHNTNFLLDLSTDHSHGLHDSHTMAVDSSVLEPFSSRTDSQHEPTSPIDMDMSLVPLPSSPLVRKRCLELDDEDDLALLCSPCSPSRRCMRSLPDMDDIEPPSSPAPSLLSLPGSDVDEALIPPPPPNFAPQLILSPIPSTPTRSLLLIDDPNDVPLPRSPSPEDFDLDLDDSTDPEVAQLHALRKRSMAAERAARHAEAQYIEQGALNLRAEARRIRQQEKERSKEVGALLQLKLGGNDTPFADTSRRTLGSISQLVARMMFRRHDTPRPPTHRKNAPMSKDRIVSPLTRYAAAADEYLHAEQEEEAVI